MSLEPMPSDEQLAKSVCHTARPYAIVPLPDGRFGLFLSYGGKRIHLGSHTGEELLTYFRNDYDDQQGHRVAAMAAADARREREAQIAASRPTAAPKLNLDDLNLNLGDLL